MFGTGLYGTTFWGGRRVSPGEPSIPEEPEEPDVGPVFLDIGIWVSSGGGGVNYSDDLIVSSLSIKEEINARGTADFSIRDDQKVYRFSLGQTVRIMLESALIFSGIIDEIEEELTGGGLGHVMIHHITCSDWTSLADRHFVTARYDTALQTLKAVVTAIVETDSGDPNECLEDSGIIVDPDMSDETKVGTCVFDHIPCSEAFDQLAEKTGYWWKIETVGYNAATGEETRYLRFFEVSKNQAPYVLDPDVWGRWRNLSIRRQQEKYRNVQYLRAGNATTTLTVTDKFKGKATTGSDKSEMSYTLRYEVAAKAKPVIVVNGSPVDAAKVDIRSDESEQDAIDWFYQVESKEITQNNRDGFDALTTSDTLQVTYYGLFPILICARNDEEVHSRADLGDGAGVHCDLESDDSIDDAEMALERAYGLISRYGSVHAKLQVETDVNGFHAGQILSVNLADHGISGQFLIESVHFKSIAEKFFRYTITAIEGGGEGSWVEFWRRLAQRTRPPAIGDNDSLYVVRQAKQRMILAETTTTTVALADYTEDNYTYAIVGKYCLGKLTPSNKAIGPMIGFPYGSGT